MPHFRVEHSMVGPHLGGTVFEITDEQAKKLGVDVQRLLRIGAIRKAESHESEMSIPWGEGGEDTPRIFPPVPFDNITSATRITEDGVPDDMFTRGYPRDPHPLHTPELAPGTTYAHEDKSGAKSERSEHREGRPAHSESRERPGDSRPPVAHTEVRTAPEARPGKGK